MKEKLKKIWEGVKKGDNRSLLLVAIVSALPVFLYSILGSIFFGITLSGSDPVVHILLIPFYLIFAYFLMQFIYILIRRWILGYIIRKIGGK